MESQRTTPVRLRVYVWTFVGLLGLATLSLQIKGLSSAAALALALLIACGKVALVLSIFMHLREEAFSFRFVIFIAAVLIGIFIALTALDPLTRAPFAPGPSSNANYRRASE